MMCTLSLCCGDVEHGMWDVGRGFGKRMRVVWELLLEEGQECLCTVLVGWMNYEDYYGNVECGPGLVRG